jgi:hypothetical protein
MTLCLIVVQQNSTRRVLSKLISHSICLRFVPKRVVGLRVFNTATSMLDSRYMIREKNLYILGNVMPL